MSNWTTDRYDVPEEAIPATAGAPWTDRRRARRLELASAETADGWSHTCLTPDEAALAKTLVDHMVLASDVASDGDEIGHELYVDAALAASFGSGDHSQMHCLRQTNPRTQGDASGTALARIGMAATNVYCKRIFGAWFVELSGKKQTGVLRLLETIKLVFQDGSGAAVFFAVVFQAMRDAEPAGS